MSKDNGGPAFPTVVEMAPELHEGMTLRDYFAAKAMQYLVCTVSDPDQCKAVAVDSYVMADAMLKARV